MQKSKAVSIGPDGYFRRGGKLIIPVGANYWPASCGVDMWAAWPEAEMQHDLDIMRDLGLNCIRFFLRWPDFEPALGEYNEIMFHRLRQFMTWCAARDILAHPALIVGGMSGGNFWPAGKEKRNLFEDPLMIERSASLCRRASEVIADFHDSVLAVDLGNELGIRDAWDASPRAVRDWCGTMSDAIRSVYPEALVVSGLDSGQVTVDYGWRLGEQPGTDFYTAHCYPVLAWNVIQFDGMTDPLAQTIFPYSVLASRMFGPVMMQEFNSILNCGRRECESYLNAIMPACRDAGANGYLWWCLRDVRAQVYPYTRNGFEGRLGLLDENDNVKPQYQCVIDFFHSLEDWQPPAPSTPEIALYWPQEYYSRENPLNPGNNPSTLYRRMILAYYLLTRMGKRVGIVRGDQPLPPDVKTLVITGAVLTEGEARNLETWVRGGGRVIWSGPTWSQWTTTVDAIVGAQPVDVPHPKPLAVECFGDRWTLPHFPHDGRVLVRLTTATVAATTDDAQPVILDNKLEQGRVLTILAVAEETMSACAADRPARDRWQRWYEGLLDMLERE